MPFVNINGQLIEVTQEQLDTYTIGQDAPGGAVAAGGSLFYTNTQEILSPNTSSTSPDQNLDQFYQPVSAADAIPGELPSEVTSGFYDNTPVTELAQDATVLYTEPARSPGSYTADELNAIALAQGVDAGDVDVGLGITESQLYDQENAAAESAARDRARQQQTISTQRRQINNGDWRVRLRLAPQSKYLYNASNPGILQPLKISDGVIFPYTPTITSNYRANYSNYDLTHSNYRGYFYQNSYVEPVQINAMFTASSTAEANYLLAVITFFKSITKMFYGQDAERGAPPPLTYLTGMGEYQFNEHPCVVSQFNYTLPADVDYVRAGSPNQLGNNQINQRDRQTVSTSTLFGGLNRLAAAFLTKGAIPNPPSPPSLGSNRPTYVPTKIEMSITLLPIQSRSQISKQFSLKEFANGNLIKGGFW